MAPVLPVNGNLCLPDSHHARTDLIAALIIAGKDLQDSCDRICPLTGSLRRTIVTVSSSITKRSSLLLANNMFFCAFSFS